MPNTREKLIELLNEVDGYCPKMCHCRDCEYNGKENCSAYAKADYFIDNGVTFATDNNDGHKWIPVTERLPKEDEDVIAFCYYHESWQAQVCHLSSNYKEQWYTSVAGQWVKVTHWMPLPEPPKGE